MKKPNYIVLMITLIIGIAIVIYGWRKGCKEKKQQEEQVQQEQVQQVAKQN